jgi:alkane 1-monooxygenase
VGLKTIAYHDADGRPMRYVDRNRWRWSLSLAIPLLPLVGIAMAEVTGWRWLVWMPVAFIYVALPALDWLVGTDSHSPPEEVMPGLEQEPFYRWLVFAAVPVHVGVLIGGFWYAMTQAQGLQETLAIVVALGFSGALAINTGHELGHKGDRSHRILSMISLAVSGYGHFRIEHNLGHHVEVATPEDSASARMGESVYRFARREIPGAVLRAWRLEAGRLRRAGRRPWSPGNEILQALGITLLLQGGLVAWLGWKALPWLVLHNLWAWFQLTGVNYIEHYGLLRQRLDDGRYERCRPRHSWNSNHLVSNLLLFHLQRHSDHHVHAERRYHLLRHFDEAPQLPSGYMGMLVLSYFPALYFRVMDPRLLAQVNGDLSRVNLDSRGGA